MFTIESLHDARNFHGFQVHEDEVAAVLANRQKYLAPDNEDDSLVVKSEREIVEMKLRAVFPTREQEIVGREDGDDRDGNPTVSFPINMGAGYFLYPTIVVVRTESILGPRYRVTDGWAIDSVAHRPATRDYPDDFDVVEVAVHETLGQAVRDLVARIAVDLCDAVEDRLDVRDP